MKLPISYPEKQTFYFVSAARADAVKIRKSMFGKNSSIKRKRLASYRFPSLVGSWGNVRWRWRNESL